MGHDRSGLAGAVQERAVGSRGSAENLHTPHRRLEAMRHQRREQPLSDAPPDRRLLRGQRDGPMWHERRGLVGAVQEWANGSRDCAAQLIVQLIQCLDVKVCACGVVGD